MSVIVQQNRISLSERGLRGKDGLLAAASSSEATDSLKPGLGDTTKAITPGNLGEVMEDLGVMMNRLKMLRPTKDKPFAQMRISKDRWWCSTFVKDGHRQDYAILEFVNRGETMTPAIAYGWSFNGLVHCTVDGVFEDFANFTGEHVGSGQLDSITPPIWEAGARIGPHASWPTGFDYCTLGHGHLKNPGCGIRLNGASLPNYRDPENSPIGVVLRGTSWVFDQTWDVYLPDNTTLAGTLAIAHLMVEGGVQIASTYTISGSNIGITTAMGMGLSSRADMLKGIGITAIAADREDGLEYGAGGALNASLGEITQFQTYNAARPTHIWEAVLGGGGAMSYNAGPYGWGQNVVGTRDSWLQDRAEGYAKVYAHGVNRNDSMLLTPGDTLAFNVIYRVRSGALV